MNNHGKFVVNFLVPIVAVEVTYRGERILCRSWKGKLSFSLREYNKPTRNVGERTTNKIRCVVTDGTI
jgi:hypothetical protein